MICKSRLVGTVPVALVLVSLSGGAAMAGDAGPHPLAAVPIQQVTIDDEFWSPKRKVWQEVTLADCFTKFENDRGGAINNFDRVRDGKTGGHAGPQWYDGLIYEMIRASADFLAARPDPALQKRLDGYIERIAAAAAKDPDGYLNTHTQLIEPTHRWGLNGGNDNAQHDVYNAGAMIEAAVHYWRATGKTRLLVTAMKLANHMCDVMGPPPKKNVVPGHSLGEEAMVKLYLVLKEHPELKEGLPFAVDETRYLKLVEFWIENRGNHEGRIDFGSYGQDHMPVLRQPTIEGHAVRATLLCTGLVAAAGVNHRDDYYQAARRLWDNMVQRRMHVTGGVGAVAGYEGFGPDYVLPNSAYLETCAAIGAGFFHHNMNLAFADARYADELERVLFNGALAGTSLKGDTYSYENPLEATKKRTRWAWHGCPCCPPMFLKIMAAMPGYVYATDRDGIYVNLFAGSRATVALAGSKVVLTQTTRYPWEGSVRIAVEPAKEAEFALYLRIPAWCDGAALKANGEKVARLEMVRGYACIRRTWRKGDVVDLDMPMPVRRIKAHPSIQADVGRVALARGPIIYCLEEADNGRRVRHLAIPPDVRLAAEHRPDLLGDVTVIKGGAVLRVRETTERPLYLAADKRTDLRIAEFVAIPYYANTNRQPGAMLVWAPETPDLAEPMPPPTIAAGEADTPRSAGKRKRSRATDAPEA